MRNLRRCWTNPSSFNCSTLIVLCATALLVACDRDMTAPSTSPSVGMEQNLGARENQIQRFPIGTPVVAPISLNIDVTQLIPAPLQLAIPSVCGVITVYDQEDLSTLCSPTTLAARSIISSNCPQTVSGSVRLETDLVCTNTDGLIVGSDNTVIDLNGHRIVCIAEPGGYEGSCQGFEDDWGIDTDGHRNVHIFSHRTGGTIDGFDLGIYVTPNSENVKVKEVIVTGPVGTPGNPRPPTVGILVAGTDCHGGPIRIGGGNKTANDISYHSRGIEIQSAACVFAGVNRVHDNRNNSFSVFQAEGIVLIDAPDNHIRGNVAMRNGDGQLFEAGIGLAFEATTGNLIVENESDNNAGDGIGTAFGASDNYIVNNEMFNNSGFDAFSDQSAVNRWNNNNRCNTQTQPQPPPGVCGPNEG